MAHDLLDVEDLDAIRDTEMDGLVRGFEQVLHERERRVSERALAGHHLPELEEPQPELELAALPLDHPGSDEGPHQPVQGRLGEARAAGEGGEAEARVLGVEGAEDPIHFSQDGSRIVPLSGSHGAMLACRGAAVNAATR